MPQPSIFESHARRAMGWSLRLLKVGGTEIRIHVTFVLLLVWLWFIYYRAGGSAAAWRGVLFLLAVFGCVLLHELGHVFAARRYGIKTPDITLLPIGGVSRMEHMPEKPSQELVVAIAGPLVNVVIAAVILLALGYRYQGLGNLAEPRAGFLEQLASVNIFLVLFNILPAFPMDGGRVLRAALATRLPRSRATQIAASIGQALAFVFGFLGLFYNPLLIFIAIFVYLGAAAEAQDAQIRDVARSLLVEDVMMTIFERLGRAATIDEAVEAMLSTAQSEFPVVDEDRRFEGLLTRDNVIAALNRSGPATPVVSVMRTDVPTIGKRRSFNDALNLMQSRNAPAVAVLDTQGRLVGLLTHENIGEMMMVRAAGPESFRFGRLRRGNGSRSSA
jgi:Zn-dependent protease/CBS domain-containing protein